MKMFGFCPRKYSISPYIGSDKEVEKLTSFRKSCRIEKYITVHTLRHTFFSWLVQAGQDIRCVQQVARHTDIQTTL
ncbi:tyrosine-type recombinase/integrase [Candidatus Venteria ishoeyi]|uniref:tyrosine-type recombinase/integrase n=1 Tax=Candidatus Venteria ishoeyi TaxID=1899563 RepID=UPI000CDECEFB